MGLRWESHASPNKKSWQPVGYQDFFVAGAGFEPAASGKDPQVRASLWLSR